MPRLPLYSGEYKRVQVQLPPDLHAIVEERSVVEGKSLSSVIVGMLRAQQATPSQEQATQWRRDSELLLTKAPVALRVLRAGDNNAALAAARELAEAVLSVALRQPAAPDPQLEAELEQQLTQDLREEDKRSSEREAAETAKRKARPEKGSPSK